MADPNPINPDNSEPEVARLTRMDLNVLVHLQVLLEERSVTRAATRIGLSQPAMSHSLGRARRLLGDDLLTRVGTALELTPRGRALIGPLTRVLREVSTEILDQPGFVPATSTRRFRISATSSTVTIVLPPLLRHIADRAPGVSIQAEPDVRHSDELLGLPDLDLALMADGLPSSLARERLYNDRWVVVVATDNEAVDGALTVAHLRSLPHVVYESQGGRIPPYAVMDTMGINRTVWARSHDFLTIPLLVPGSPALAVIQERVARRFASAGLVRTFPLPIAAPPLGIDMVWNPRLAQDPARRWLRDQLIASVERSAP